LWHEPKEALVILGSVVLAITGGEALYADLGHFGRPAMERAWYALVLPGLLLNYFGQGALALRQPSAVDNLFFEMAPEGPWRAGLLGLSIAASVIASQALISGCFSLSRQATQLGYLPRMAVRHTSSDQEGQIYVPSVNWALMVGCVFVVLLFKGSENLAAAYGIAVTGTMGITTVAYYQVVRKLWHWPVAKAASICGAFLIVDLLFFASNLRKILEGGWFPLAVGAALLTIMLTWKRGRAEIGNQLRSQMVEPELIVKEIEAGLILRVPGTAVFMTANPTGTPISLLHHLKANKCLQKNTVLLTFIVEHVPRVEQGGHIQVEPLGGGIVRVVVRYGYMENPDAPSLVHLLNDHGIKVDLRSTYYYFNQEMIVCTGRSVMPSWQKQLYRTLSRNSNAARDYFGIPPNQIVEMGLPILL
jgi:KUP system potassium uptake protein